MSIVILLICFVFIFLLIGALSNSRATIAEIVIKSVLTFSTLLVVITELISVLSSLNFVFVFTCWACLSVLMFFCLFWRHQKLIEFIRRIKERIDTNYRQMDLWEKFLSYTIVSILLLIFFQGLLYPPNNWDSMTYHMARISNWISHETVAHYPTHIIRQLYQPPFAEFTILHFNILNGADYFSNSVQWLFLFFSLILIGSIINLLELGRQYIYIGIALAVTIPEVLLQSSSTQNDVITSFFILASFYYSIKAVLEVAAKNFLFLGIAVGLALLTKATSYLFLGPILLLFALFMVHGYYKARTYNYILYMLMAAAISISINAGHYLRNYYLSNNLLGIDKTESRLVTNENMTPVLLISNTIKNVGLHTGPYPINRIANKLIIGIHSIANIPVNDKATTLSNLSYTGSPDIPNHEDSASNTFHFLLIFFSLMLIGVNGHHKKDNKYKFLLYSLVVVLQAIFFCLYLKWQPWHSRLHTPLFLLSIPLICYAVSVNIWYRKVLKILIPFFIIYGLLIVVFNASRPFLTSKYTSEILINDSRYKKYFTNQPHLYEEYSQVSKNIKNDCHKNIGLIIGGDDWEYPLFFDIYSSKIKPVHLQVFHNISKNLINQSTDIDCIISTSLKVKSIEFKGKHFYIQNSENKYIWAYE